MEGPLATHVTFPMWTVRGKAISEFRSPNALPRAPTPLGTEGVLRCCKCKVVDFCLYAAIFRAERYAELIPVFFHIYNERLCQYSYTFKIPGQDTVCFRPLPRIYVFSYQLEMSARGSWYRAGLLRRRGDIYLGCGRRRYCGRVSCLSQRRVLALTQWF